MNRYKCPECLRYVKERPQTYQYWEYDSGFANWVRKASIMCVWCIEDKEYDGPDFPHYTITYGSATSASPVASNE